MMKPRILLVGLGKFGKNHFRVLKKLERVGLCELYGVVDTNSKVLNNYKGQVARFSTDYHDFLDCVDAVDIVTPAHTHYAITRECLEASKHVFVEKPLALSYNDARELVHLAKDQGVILMVGHIFRYNKAVSRIKDIVRRGEIGEVYYLFGHFMGLKNPRSDVGVVFNYIHHIDIYDYILEKMPTEILCSAGYFLGREEFEDAAVIILKYPPKIFGVIEVSWMTPKSIRDITVIGSKKALTIDLLKDYLELHDVSIESCEGQYKAMAKGAIRVDLNHARAREEPLLLELRGFIESIKSGQEPLASGQVALRSIKIAEKALESAKIGRKVYL